MLSLRPSFLLAAAVVVLGISLPGQAAQLTAVASTANALLPTHINQFNAQQSPTGTVAAFLDVEAYPNIHEDNYGYHGTGGASATFLTLGATAQVIVNDFTPLSYNSSSLFSGQAQSTDTLTVLGSGPGFFELSFYLTGSAANSNGAIIRSGVTFIANVAEGGVNLNSFALGYLPLGEVTTGLIPITLGVPFNITAQLTTSISVFTAQPHAGPVLAGIFYGNTAALTGVQVYDAAGNPLESFTILADSGTDYAAVPEPATAFLLAGAALLMLRRCPTRGGSKGSA